MNRKQIVEKMIEVLTELRGDIYHLQEDTQGACLDDACYRLYNDLENYDGFFAAAWIKKGIKEIEYEVIHVEDLFFLYHHISHLDTLAILLDN